MIAIAARSPITAMPFNFLPWQVRELGKREVYAEVHHLDSFTDASGAPNFQRLNLARAISEISDSGQLDMVTSPNRNSSLRSNKVAPLDVSSPSVLANSASDGKMHLSPISPLGMSSIDMKDFKRVEEFKDDNSEGAKEPAVVLTVKAEAPDMPVTDLEEYRNK